MTVRAGMRLMMTTDAVGGVWTFSASLGRALAARGVEVLLVNMGPRPGDQQRERLLGVRGVTVHETDLQLEWQDPAGLDLANAKLVLDEIVARFAPDLIQFNSYREAAFGWTVPTLVVAHSCVNSWMEACGQHGAFAGSAWATYTTNVTEGLACADTWAAPTASFRDWIATRYGVAGGRAVWNGIEDSETSIMPKHPIVLAAGRVWDAAKNLASLQSVAPGIDWPIRIAGAADVKGTSAGAIIAHCDVLGALPPPQMRREMERASIFVSPALYEPFGLSVLEAARAGCALVLSDLPSFRELWSGAALFVDPVDPAAVRQALRKLCDDAPLLLRMQQAAHERSRRYDLRQTASDYCELYVALLDRAAPSMLNARMSA
jgi:hypothetical protein